MSVDFRAEDFDPILEIVAEDLVERIRRKIEAKKLVFTGQLKKDIEIEKVGDYEYQIVLKAPHAGKMEFGADPHTPDFELLYRWVLQKKGEPEEFAEAATWRIIHKIEREGLEPRLFVKEAIEEVADRV